MKFTFVTPHSPNRVDREYNAGLGAGFSIGNSLRAKLLELMRGHIAEPPFSLFGYLAAIVAKNGHDVRAEAVVPADGVAVFAPSLANFNGDLAAMKEASAREHVKVVAVGNLASALPQEFEAIADLVIKGEPESLFQSFMNLSDLPSGVVQAKAVEDLDSLPNPDWRAFAKNDNANFSYAFSESSFAFVQGSRSCPYTCEYCPYITTSSYRRRSVANVIDEIISLRDRHDVRAVVFRDPTFTLHRQWVVEFCEAMISQSIDVKWECETRFDRMDIELVQLMRDAGLRSVKFGVESADEHVLKDVKRRPANLVHQETIVSECKRLGVSVVGFYVLALPADTRETVRSTIKYAKKLNTDIARFHIFTPLPGTPLYTSVKDRIFESNWEKFDMFNVVFRHEHLSTEEIYRLKEQAYVEYYFRLGYVARRLSALFTKLASKFGITPHAVAEPLPVSSGKSA